MLAGRQRQEGLALIGAQPVVADAGLRRLGLHPVDLPRRTLEGLAPGLDPAWATGVLTREDWRIEIGDRGPGMTETQLSQALLPFYSTKRADAGAQGGTGLPDPASAEPSVLT